jgi:pyruvate/2-oxoglutarate dehydrogenase complex dihydrolipoamide dehydrogenase (E3) component
VDLNQVRQRKRAIVEEFRASGQRRLEKTENVKLSVCAGCIAAPKVVEVTLENHRVWTLAADLIIINTGARPARFRLEGLESLQTLDSTSIIGTERIDM